MATEDKSITDDDLDNLTAEERAALEGDDDNQDDDTDADTDTEGDDDEDQDDAGNDDDDDTAADDDAADAPGRDDGKAAEDAPADEPSGKTEQAAPVFVAEAPAGADARLAEISAKKEELIAQFDDGDITAKEYQTQLDALGKDERAIERAIDKAAIASEMESQRQTNEWISQANAFAAANGYTENPRLYRALDAEVRDVATTEAGKLMNGPQILAKAHANLVEAGLVAGSAGTGNGKARAKIPRADLPPNLARVPAADSSDTSGGRFASLDRLQSSDPIAYEERLMAMSENDRKAYLAT